MATAISAINAAPPATSRAETSFTGSGTETSRDPLLSCNAATPVPPPFAPMGGSRAVPTGTAGRPARLAEGHSVSR
jgi:hypothetical protein